MSDGDIKVLVDPFGTYEFDVASGSAASIGPGEPVNRSTNYAALAADATPVVGSHYLIGIANNTSTDTTAAAGKVSVTLAGPGTVIRGKALLSTTVDTVAEILALKFDSVYFDLTSSVFTIDAANNSSTISTNGLIVIDGDSVAYTLDCTVNSKATLFAASA